MIDILRMNYSSGDLNFIREIKLNEITEKIIRDLLRVDPSHRANSFIIRNGPESGLQTGQGSPEPVHGSLKVPSLLSSTLKLK